MLEAANAVPDVQVWADVREGARPLRVILGDGLSLLCFYLHDWSPT